MWFKRTKDTNEEIEAPEKLRYSRYYEHDGALRAYANRAMLLAFLTIPATLLAIGFAVYVRLQPPTVIRVDENGQAAVLGQTKPGISIAGMQKENLIGKIEDDQTTSDFQLRSLEPTKDEPLTYTAFGVKEVHHIHDHNETVDKVVSEFQVRLVVERRTEQNPSGLLIGEYWERAIEGEKRDWVLQQAGLTNQR
jgi:hypothetical protein